MCLYSVSFVGLAVDLVSGRASTREQREIKREQGEKNTAATATCVCISRGSVHS